MSQKKQINPNPKEGVVFKSLPLHLVPDIIEIEASLAYAEGAIKYGNGRSYGWRNTGVTASVYLSAARRHLMKWWNGEDVDRYTDVKHLASVVANVGILLDADVCGVLTDDRPHSASVPRRITSTAVNLAILRNAVTASPEKKDLTEEDTDGK